MTGVRIDERRWLGRVELVRGRSHVLKCHRSFEHELGFLFLPVRQIGAGEVLEAKCGHFGATVEGLELCDIDVEVETTGGDREGFGHQRECTTHRMPLGEAPCVLDQVVDRPIAESAGGHAVGQPQVGAMLLGVRVQDRVVCALRLGNPPSAQVRAGVGQECFRPSIHANYDTTITPSSAPGITKYYSYTHVGHGGCVPV